MAPSTTRSINQISFVTNLNVSPASELRKLLCLRSIRHYFRCVVTLNLASISVKSVIELAPLNRIRRPARLRESGIQSDKLTAAAIDSSGSSGQPHGRKLSSPTHFHWMQIFFSISVVVGIVPYGLWMNRFLIQNVPRLRFVWRALLGL